MGQFDLLRDYFQILGDVSRLRIIKFINSNECTVSQIVNETNLSQPLISHHLKILKNSKILEAKRVGPFIYYKLVNPKLLDVLGLFEDVLPKDSDINNSNYMFKYPS